MFFQRNITKNVQKLAIHLIELITSVFSFNCKEHAWWSIANTSCLSKKLSCSFWDSLKINGCNYGRSRYKKRDLLSLATTILINFRVLPVWAFLIIYTMRFLFGYINTTFFWQRTTLLNLLSISITKKNFLTELLDMCRI